jgi:hypothetical protein
MVGNIAPVIKQGEWSSAEIEELHALLIELDQDEAVYHPIHAMAALRKGTARKSSNPDLPSVWEDGRDMILIIPLVTDLQQLQKRRQELIDTRLIQASTKPFSYDYAVGDEVLRLAYRPIKLEPRASSLTRTLRCWPKPFVVCQQPSAYTSIWHKPRTSRRPLIGSRPGERHRSYC